MFDEADIEKSIEGTLNDLEGFVHPMWGRQEKGTGIYYIPTNFVYFATGRSIYDTIPEQYDGIIKDLFGSCDDDQREKVRLIVQKIIDENELNKFRMIEKPGRGFNYCAYSPGDYWGAAMLALGKYFDVELQTT